MYLKLCAVFLFFLTTLMGGEIPMNALKPYISKEQIQEKIKIVAAQIDQEYGEEEVVIVMIMKGAFVFAADLLREIKNPYATIDFIQCRSYGKNGTKRGELLVLGVDRLDLEGKNVILVDDIFDSGNTLTQTVKAFEKKNPKSLKTLLLLTKRAKKIPEAIAPDISLFEIEDKFVLGYGLDYKEFYRGLDSIYYIEE